MKNENLCISIGLDCAVPSDFARLSTCKVDLVSNNSRGEDASHSEWLSSLLASVSSAWAITRGLVGCSQAGKGAGARDQNSLF